MKRPTYIYVAGTEYIPSLAKIGKSFEPVSRIAHLRIYCPGLKLVGVWLQAEKINETALLHYFREHRLYGEWFSLPPEEIAKEIDFLCIDCEVAVRLM